MIRDDLQPEAGWETRVRKVIGNRDVRAGVFALPFLLMGIGNVAFVIWWGIEFDPLWSLLVLPPVLFCTILAFVAFRTDFFAAERGRKHPRH